MMKEEFWNMQILKKVFVHMNKLTSECRDSGAIAISMKLKLMQGEVTASIITL